MDSTDIFNGACLAKPPMEAGEPIIPNENSRILTFPTLYEN